MDRAEPLLVTRRAALAASLAAAGTLALGRSGFALADDTPGDSPYGPFRMGLQSYSLRHFKLDEALAKTKELGLHYWESFNAHIPSDPKTAEAMSRKAAEYGVKVAGYGVVHFGKDMDANRKLFEFGKAINLMYMSCDPRQGEPRRPRQARRRIRHPDRHPQPRPRPPVGEDRRHHGRHQGPQPEDRLLHRHRPLPPLQGRPRPRRRGLRQADLRRASEGREGLNHVQDPRRRRPPHGRASEGLAKRKYNYVLALEYEESEAMPMDDIRACIAAEKKAASGL